MSDADPIIVGARWWKFDFHTHTRASTDWDRDNPNRDQLTSRDWLLAYMHAGIDCVAITDHNSGEWIDRLKGENDALRTEKPEGYRPLCLFPGIEISVNGGIHLLAIFRETKTTADVTRLIGLAEYEGTTGDSDGVTKKSMTEVIEAVCRQGGIPIPAHVERGKGLLEVEGESRRAKRDTGGLIQVIDSGLIFAMESVDQTRQRPEVFTQRKLKWAEVLGSDSHSLQGIRAPGSAYTWVKMGTPSFDGLRLALLDGEKFSIRRSDDPFKDDPNRAPDHMIKSIEIRNARFMGKSAPAKLHFGPWFNAIVGGRGTGKSTIVHALRLAYHRQGELAALNDAEPRQTFERFIQTPKDKNDRNGALAVKGPNETSIIVELDREDTQHRLEWKQTDNRTKIFDRKDNDWLPAPAQDVSPDRFRIRLLSQGQIAALAGDSSQGLLSLIDDAADVRPIKAELGKAHQKFFSHRARIRELETAIAETPSVETQLEDVKRKLTVFESKEHAAVLKSYQRRNRQARVIDRQLETAGDLATALASEAEKLGLSDLPIELFDSEDPADKSIKEIADRLDRAVLAGSESVRNAGVALRQAIEEVRSSIASGQWTREVQTANTNYLKLAEELKSSGIADPTAYGELVVRRQEIERNLAHLRGIRDTRDRLEKEVADLREDVFRIRRKLSDRRTEFLESTLKGNEYVRIRLQPYGRDAELHETELRTLLGTIDARFPDAFKALTEILQQGTGEAAEIEHNLEGIRNELIGAKTGVGAFNNFLERGTKRSPELGDRIAVWTPEDTLDTEYSRTSDGHNFTSIAQGSAGQRAAAMLAFLLSFGNEPLVLDQPEDDLDNQLIYDLIVAQIRENKPRRQLIIVTHNPNIVVNGDAEMIHSMEFKWKECELKESGSLQDPAVRREICKVMEGGKEAFERRYRRLGGID